MNAAEEIADVAVIGAGLAGMTAALALGAPASRTEISVLLIDADEAGQQISDMRALAITQSSRRMLDIMGLWPSISPQAEALREVVVSDGWPGGNGQAELLHIHDRSGAGSSAHFVASDLLRDVLSTQLKQSKHVRKVRGRLVRLNSHKAWAEIETKQGERYRARLVIAADGKDSSARAAAGIEKFEHRYLQTGIVTTIAHDLPHGGCAYERFLPAGPFAMLPLKGNRSSIVWTEEEGLAQKLMVGPDDRFLAELQRRAGGELGTIRLAGNRQAHGLSLMVAKSFGQNRTVLVGDAAHVIHPLAGLGFNLGMRDVAALAEVVSEEFRLGLDVGGEAVLQKYQSWRRVDTMMNAAFTDGLNRLFSNDNEAVRRIRDLGLQIVNSLPIVKSLLIAEAAGLTGELPKLMKGEAL
jgi:2-octaprenyl-6-methoxyphenol hydroxylase